MKIVPRSVRTPSDHKNVVSPTLDHSSHFSNQCPNVLQNWRMGPKNPQMTAKAWGNVHGGTHVAHIKKTISKLKIWWACQGTNPPSSTRTRFWRKYWAPCRLRQSSYTGSSSCSKVVIGIALSINALARCFWPANVSIPQIRGHRPLIASPMMTMTKGFQQGGNNSNLIWFAMVVDMQCRWGRCAEQCLQDRLNTARCNLCTMDVSLNVCVYVPQKSHPFYSCNAKAVLKHPWGATVTMYTLCFIPRQCPGPEPILRSIPWKPNFEMHLDSMCLLHMGCETWWIQYEKHIFRVGNQTYI